MIKKYIYIVFLFFGVITYSQTDQETPEEMYLEYLNNVNKNDLTTGFLLNRGFMSDDEIVSLYQYIEGYNEETNEVIPPMSIMDGVSWVQTYNSLVKSEINAVKQLPKIESINQRFQDKTPLERNVPILIYDVKGELLEEDEIENSINGRPLTTPYNTIQLFGAMAMNSNFYKKQISFSLSQINYFSGNANIPSSIYIDFSDGRGIQEYNTSVGEIVVTYNSLGEKVVKVYRDIQIGSNSLRLGSSFKINIKTNLTQQVSKVIEAENSVKFSKKDGTIIGRGGKAVIYNGSKGNKLDKPVIVVQGFDPTGEIFADSQHEKYQSFFDNNLSSEGYDMVYVLLNNTNLSLPSNVAVVKDLIKKINAQKEGNFESIVIGESMGGLLSRVALKELENENYDHQVGLYVSFDAPHRGANIPPGLQHLFKDALDLKITRNLGGIAKVLDLTIIGLYNVFKAIFTGNNDTVSLSDALQLDKAYRALDALNSPAAKSMLVRHIDPGNYFVNTQSYLRNTGYSEHTRNIALINGSNRNVLQRNTDGSVFVPGNTLVRFPLWRSDCNEFSLEAWSSPINRRMRVSRIKWKIGLKIPDIRIRWEIRTVIGIFGVRIRTRVPVRVVVGTKCATTNLLDKEKEYTFNAASYDNAPGSTLPGLSDLPFDLNAETTFVPTASSIDLNRNAYNASTNPDGLRAINSTTTLNNFISTNRLPFDEVYSSGINSVHVFFGGISNQFRNVIDDEFMINDLTIQDKVISNTRDYEANDEIRIGHDMNTISRKIFETGDVVVNSGTRINVSSGNTITIGPGTHIKNGAIANFKINTSLTRRSARKNGIEDDFKIAVIGDDSYKAGEEPAFKALVSNLDNEYTYNWTLLENQETNSGEEFFINSPLPFGMYTLELKVVSKKSFEEKIITKVFQVKNQFEITQKEYEIGKAPSANFVTYPNPTKDNVTIISEKKINRIVLTDISGAIKESVTVNRTWGTINMQKLASGTYMIKVLFTDNTSMTKKVIKE
ncbi:T9SS type A sorting domain-containing protein [Aquimarina sp. 2201CG1-2-11]|uniref:T9SS type A sorting domain-containing protein n=1 Tax=Aquimarina discodermiae TaxID=3231043 RepID=UPI00346249D3